MIQYWSFPDANLLDDFTRKGRHVAEAELARVGDVRGEQGHRVFIHRPVKLDDKRRVPRAGQPLGDPFLVPGGGRKVRPERRVIKRNLTPTSAYMRDMDPTQRIGQPRECDEVEDTHKDLWREDEDRQENVAGSEHGEDQTLQVRGVNVLWQGPPRTPLVSG